MITGARNKKTHGAFVTFLSFALVFISGACAKFEKVGVLFIVHGGMDTMQTQFVWDTAMQQFSYDPNHPANGVIHNAALWNVVLQQEVAKKYRLKYDFEYTRIGGTDPFREISLRQLAAMKEELAKLGAGARLRFEVDWAAWMCGDCIEHYPYPRYMYYPPSGQGDTCTYCGEQESDGPWSGCDPDRYNVDGPVERLLKKGVSRIIAIDLTVGGVRFSKTFDVIELSKRVINQWNTQHKTSVSLVWVNDYKNLMERSYPIAPAGWTMSKGLPTEDAHVPLEGNPNPLAEDLDLAALHVAGIEANFSATVDLKDTGIILLNHALHDNNEVFDPKIDDTLIINKNIKSLLCEKYPDINADNIIGAYMGIKDLNPENGLVERTREMRGEDLGYAWLYESNKQLPGHEWGYRYWDALQYLKDRGIKHIVIGFPQIVTDSVLNLVEIHNQIAKEIGFKNWLYWTSGNNNVYPGIGHPFTDYWGNWVDTMCGTEPCCFEMGGCDDGRPYPPPRQTELEKKRGDMDPSLAYDVSEYGHLGHDPGAGPPDMSKPVQNQYTGTWALWTPPNDDPRVGTVLAKYVLKAALNELP